MVAITLKKDEPKTADWQDGFLQILPTINRHARFAFRRLDFEAREEAIAEVTANAMCAF